MSSCRLFGRFRLVGLAGLSIWVAAACLGAPDAGATPAEDEAQLARGKRIFLYCAACHTIVAQEPDKVGPNLHGVIGSAAASRGHFPYSAALRASGITWTEDRLNVWLKQPAALVPGTKMAFPGLPKDQDRADLLAYLAKAAR